MPILTHCFDEFPSELESDFAALYGPSFHLPTEERSDPFDDVKRKMREPMAKLYAAHFGGRWLAAAVVTGDARTRLIHHLRVHHSVRLRGIGRHLSKEIKRQEQLAGYERLVTCVATDNHPAQYFLQAIQSSLTAQPETPDTTNRANDVIASPNTTCYYDLLYS